MSKLLWCSQKGVWQNESQLKVYPSYVVDFFGEKKKFTMVYRSFYQKEESISLSLESGLGHRSCFDQFHIRKQCKQGTEKWGSPCLTAGKLSTST